MYGASIGSLFGRMKAKRFSDPFEVSKSQFSGSGSFGNGGAMRITPVALYGLNLSDKEFNVGALVLHAVNH